jgi:hypothetical protein
MVSIKASNRSPTVGTDATVFIVMVRVDDLLYLCRLYSIHSIHFRLCDSFFNFQFLFRAIMRKRRRRVQFFSVTPS